jgi:hypothetical protein
MSNAKINEARIAEIEKSDPAYAAELRAMLEQDQEGGDEVIPHQFTSEPLTKEENERMLSQLREQVAQAEGRTGGS